MHVGQVPCSAHTDEYDYSWNEGTPGQDSTQPCHDEQFTIGQSHYRDTVLVRMFTVQVWLVSIVMTMDPDGVTWWRPVSLPVLLKIFLVSSGIKQLLKLMQLSHAQATVRSGY